MEGEINERMGKVEKETIISSLNGSFTIFKRK